MKRIVVSLVILSLLFHLYAFAAEEEVEIKLQLNLDQFDQPVDVSYREFALYKIPKDHGLLRDSNKYLEQYIFSSDQELKETLGDPILSGPTNTEGVVKIGGLAPGHYLVKEQGYGKDGFVVMPFIADLSSNEYYPKMINYSHGCVDVLVLHKKDQTPLKGVKFKLVRIDGDKKKDVLFKDGRVSKEGNVELVSDAQGKIRVDHLLPGSYQLVPLEEIKGYRLISPHLAFTIESGQEVCSFLLVYYRSLEVNTALEGNPPKLPATGSLRGNLVYPLVFLLLGLHLYRREKVI